MRKLELALIGFGAAILLPIAAHATDEAAQPATETEQATAPKCLEAVVNPVTGYAFCTNPRGAPVEAPPQEAYQRPCKPRAHDEDPWTVYEHASGCGD